MAGFAGFVAFDGRPADRNIEDRLARRGVARGQAGWSIRRASSAVIVQQSNAEAPLGPPDENSDIFFAADARLDNKVELAEALGLQPHECLHEPDSTLILRMYRRFGEAGIARCIGAFAFVAWNQTEKTLTLGRDCVGHRSLFFYRGDGFVAFATVLSDLFLLSEVPRRIDELAVANFLACNHKAQRQTVYAGIERVPNRNLVRITPQRTTHKIYWAPEIDKPLPFRREEDYIERARELFDQSVACATRDLRDVAISASGGLDSSAIAATVARQGNARSITLYTLVPPEGFRLDVGPDRYLCERDKIAALRRRYPELNVQFIEERALHTNERAPANYFLAFGLPAPITGAFGPQSFLYEAVKADNHHALLMGTRGNCGLTWKGSRAVLASLCAGRVRESAREFSIIAGENGAIRAAASQIVSPLLSPPLRRALYRVAGRDPDDVSEYSALHPDFIAAQGLPLAWQKQGFDPAFGLPSDIVKYRAELMFDFNQHGRDMVAMFSRHYGFAVRDVLADRRLLEFSLGVPEYFYRQNGVARAFARKVFADRLPVEILAEQRRGAHDVTWFCRLNARRDAIQVELERLKASPTARRLIDIDRLERLVREWPIDEHAAEERAADYHLAFERALHVGQFIRWVEGGNG